MDKLEIPKNDDDDQVSSSTLSYNAWNSKSLVNWQDFEEVTGPSHGRASPDGVSLLVSMYLGFAREGTSFYVFHCLCPCILDL
jgi:hypothetical protein